MAKSETSSKRNSIIKWLITSVVVPILCASTGIYVAVLTLDKPVTYIYKEVSNLDSFVVTEYFPLEEGNYWIYSYTKKETLPNSTKVEESSGTIKMMVDKVRKYDNCVLFEMKGDIISQDSNKLFGYLVIANKVYYVGKSNLSQLIDSLENKKPITYEFYLDIPLEFEFPMFEGQKYGDLSGMIRNDLKYVSNVNKENTFFSKIDNRLEENSVYTIIESYVGSDKQMTFVPYVGITSAQYHHRGTVSDYEVELLEYKVNTK